MDGATTTCKQGLNVDPGNKQLEKLLRQAKTRKSSERMKATKTAAAAAPMPVPGAGGDSSMSKELMDLQDQLRKTIKDYNVVSASIQASEKSYKVNEITLGELEKIPMEEDRKMYRGVGKIFMMESKDEVFGHLNQEMKEDEKKIEDLKQKKDYLERRMKSQQQNILECAGSK